MHSLFYYRYDKRRNPKTKQYCKYLRHQQECIIRQPLVLLSVMAIFFDTIAIDMNSIVDCQSARYIVRMIIWMEHGVMMWNVEICNRCIYRYISRLVCRLCTVQYCPVKVSDDSIIDPSRYRYRYRCRHRPSTSIDPSRHSSFTFGDYGGSAR